MELSTRINIILCVLSFILAATSVITVILTLKQNNRMIEASTRPYMSVYLDNSINKATLVVKNYGASACTITKFEPSIDLSELTFGSGVKPFDHLTNYVFPPGHALTTVFEYRRIANYCDSFTVVLSYKSSTKTYDEKININIEALRELFASEPKINKDAELKYMVKALNSIDQKLMQLK